VDPKISKNGEKLSEEDIRTVAYVEKLIFVESERRYLI
jgi:hypothetical protein